MGSFDQLLPDSAPLEVAKESYAPDRNPGGKRTHLLEVTGSVIGGQLRIEFLYSENFHNQATIQLLADYFLESLRSLIEHCVSPESGGYTPSDFPEAELDQDDLDEVLAALNN
jgi:non-ribosomal peptide synthase protein (TIGR01720 family)